MSRILVNYSYSKTKDKYTILDSDCVFADLPVAVMDSEAIINEPLVIIENNTKTVVDKFTYLLTHKCFKLAITGDGNLIETPQGNSFFTDLDVKFEDLKLNSDGQIVIVKDEKEDVPVEETKKEKKEKEK